ncbi:uncharacterized protein LOC134279977 [Saccostrea cucullata]|uniref:uncharacterized protein LOC134279977 n=1 Tax=Saccostrea cuccullata TaxID=36930 RepID=UPI002ECFCA7D
MDHDHEPYDILSLKCNSSNISRGNSFKEPVYKEAAHSSHCSATSEHIYRKSFLYPEQMLKKDEEKFQMHKILEENPLLSTAETMEFNQGHSNLTENTKRQRRKYRESKKREREEYMYGFTMMLENFKPRQESDGIGEFDRPSKDQRKSSKKNERKVLRYSFARPLEMN